MRIRSKSLEAWVRANFTRSKLKSIAERGAIMGWPGLTYYSQTTKLYAKFKKDIWERLTEESEACGYSNPFEYLGVSNYAKLVDDVDTMENSLAWHAVESIAYQITQNDDD